MSKRIKWYFDFISPFSYLQLKRLEQARAPFEIEMIPVLFAGLLKKWGHKGPAEIEPKRLDTYTFCQWYADTHDIPFQVPQAHPFNPLSYLRLCIALGSTPRNIHDIFNFLWGECPPVHQAEAIQGLAKRLGVAHLDQLLSDPKVKTELISNTESAIEDGVYGVPTFVIDEQRFWGLDQMDMMLDFLERGMMIDAGEYARLTKLPYGSQRS